MISSKSGLAVSLSRLETFTRPDVGLEQYPTDSEIAASVLWNASLLGDIEGKTIADLGCGTGILGIGALMLGAEKVYLVDTDKDALKVAEKNLEATGIDQRRYQLFNKAVSEFSRKADVVIQNPPFGTRKEHADKEFLEKAFELSDMIYSFHKSSTERFVRAISEDAGFEVTHEWRFAFPLKRTQDYHKRKIQRIEVTCFRMKRRE